MTEALKAIAAYSMAIFLSHVSQHYHLTGEQSAAVAADLGTVATLAGGVVMHVRAWLAQPPKAS